MRPEGMGRQGLLRVSSSTAEGLCWLWREKRRRASHVWKVERRVEMRRVCVFCFFGG